MNAHDWLSDDERAALGDLDALDRRLREYTVPEPDSARLLAALKPVMAETRSIQLADEPPRAKATRLDEQPSPPKGLYTADEDAFEVPLVDESLVQPSGFSPRRDDARRASRRPLRFAFRDWLRLVWMQTNLIEMPFWWASLLVAGIGVFLGAQGGSAVTTLWLILLSPVLAVGGVTYIFRPATRTLWELEQFSLHAPFEVLYARLTLILLFNLGLASLLLIVAGTQGLQMVLWRLLLLWLAPMIGLTGIALFFSLRWNNVVGVIAAMTVWGAVIALGLREVFDRFSPEMLSFNSLIVVMDSSALLPVLALATLIAGIICVIESGRWLAHGIDRSRSA